MAVAFSLCDGSKPLLAGSSALKAYQGVIYPAFGEAWSQEAGDKPCGRCMHVQGCCLDAIWQRLEEMQRHKNILYTVSNFCGTQKSQKGRQADGSYNGLSADYPHLRGVNGSYPLRTMQDRHRVQECEHRVHQQVNKARRGQNP